MSVPPRVRRSLCLLGLLVLSSPLAGTSFVGAVAPQGTGPGATATITTFTYGHGGTVAVSHARPLLWQSGSHTFTVVVSAGNGSGRYDVCLETASADGAEPTTLACRGATVEGGSQTTVDVGIDRWPANHTGEQVVTAVLVRHDATADRALDRRTLQVAVLSRDADPDGDGLTNEREVAGETDLFAADTDDDGLADDLELDTYGTSPTRRDSDGDGLIDATETDDHQTDPTAPDTDDDGLTDDLEVETRGTNPNRADTDGDGLSDALEVNTYGTAPDRADTDDDGLADAAEANDHATNPTRADTDGDGLGDGSEVNVHGTGPSKPDTDEDGLPDASELGRHQTDPARTDTDGDGLDDGVEVRTYRTNPNRADTDGDGLDDGEESRAGTHPLTPDVGGATAPQPIPTPVLLGLLAVVGVVLLGLGAFHRRSDGAGLVARLRRPKTETGTGAAPPAAGDSATEASTAGVRVTPIRTDRDRVVELLAANDGRMLQSDIVEATDWSKSKVSRVLSGMDDDGEIAKIDVGRGNLITLPDVIPPNTRSPLDRDEG